MSVSTVEFQPRPLAAPAQDTLWGMTAAELHDAYWQSLGVRVARAGANRTLERDAGLYLLVGPGVMALVDFRRVLAEMGWLSPGLCLVRPRSPMPDPSADDMLSGQILRCAFTPVVELAASWHVDNGTPRAWRRLKRQVADGRYCISRPLGRLYGQAGAPRFLERLAQIWRDPAPSVPGLQKLRRGVFGMDPGAAKDIETLGGKKQIWLGVGRSAAEAANGESPHVLLDAD